uniref:Uncharacterized protein n=1 Tax=Yersinia ruckeri TaxID=29486 RepID=A0A0A8VEQ7_YERRU|nr:hypothetical protein CSF007_11665 [Yersinia ruckeri]
MISEPEQQHQRFEVAVGFFFQEIQQPFYLLAVASGALVMRGYKHYSP